MNKREAKRVLDAYFRRCDETVGKWMDSRNDPEKRAKLRREDFFLNVLGVSSEGGLVTDELMPEPYWGDPEGCLIVVANHNPEGETPPDESTGHGAATAAMIRHVSRVGYGAFARAFPIADPLPDELSWFAPYTGRGWWQGRENWARRFPDLFPGADDPAVHIFAFDVCPWHSRHWKTGSHNARILSPDNRAAFLEAVAKPFEAALTLSRGKFGLCVGNVYADLLTGAGFAALTGWGRFAGENNRHFQLFKKGACRVLVAQGVQGQRAPAPHFDDHVRNLLNGKENLV